MNQLKKSLLIKSLKIGVGCLALCFLLILMCKLRGPLVWWGYMFPIIGSLMMFLALFKFEYEDYKRHCNYERQRRKCEERKNYVLNTLGIDEKEVYLKNKDSILKLLSREDFQCKARLTSRGILYEIKVDVTKEMWEIEDFCDYFSMIKSPKSQ